MVRAGGFLPSDGALKLYNTNTEDEVLVKFQGLVSSYINRLESFYGFIVTPALAHLRWSVETHMNTTHCVPPEPTINACLPTARSFSSIGQLDS